MLDTLFLQILNMSFTASCVIVFVLAVRVLLAKVPKKFLYALWSVVLFRLCCPFSFESALSIFSLSGATMDQLRPFPETFTTLRDVVPSQGIGNTMQTVQPVVEAAEPRFSGIFTLIWLLGIAALLIYSVVSLLKLRHRLKDAAQESGNIYTAASLTSPFVMGLFRPKIYLPAHLTEEETRYIVLHEQTHIKRLDHVMKIVSFLVLCLHWFNPLVWVAFFLSGRDMELSCDEAVIKKLGSEVKKDYSSSLLTLATGRRIVGGTPLAFGEGDTKSRIQHVLNYKKPAFWVIIVSVLAVAAVGLGLAANPQQKPTGVAGINAIILEIDRASQSMEVKVMDQNSAIGDTTCILDWSHANLQTAEADGKLKTLSIDDFAAGDAVVLFVGEIQEGKPFLANATTIQLVPAVPALPHDVLIMTEEIGAIGCEYGVNKDHRLDTLQMIGELETLQGFQFDSDWASHGYVKFDFLDQKPKSIFLRCCANVDDIWLQEYPIDAVTYQIKVPSKAGVYNFFADITWENGEQETVYFCITVSGAPDTSKPQSDQSLSVTFPAYGGRTEANAKIFDIEPFVLHLSLPTGWSVKPKGEKDIKYPLMGAWTPLGIYNADGAYIGAVGYNIFDREVADYKKPMTIYNQISLGNHYQFNAQPKENGNGAYQVLSEDENQVTAMTAVYHSAAMARDLGYGDPERINRGILSCDKKRFVYLAIELDEALVTEAQGLLIAKSIRFSAA